MEEKPMNKTTIEWADFTVNPIIFETVIKEKKGCPHRCPYCYDVKIVIRFEAGHFTAGFYPERIAGQMKQKTIFVESFGDLFHHSVPPEQIITVLEKCQLLDTSNTIVLLTKNPERYGAFKEYFQPNFVIGFTMETHAYPNNFNNNVKDPMTRAEDFLRLQYEGDSFICAEPAMQLNRQIYLSYIETIKPKYLVFGLNTVKSVKLPEPSYQDILFLMENAKKLGIKVILKRNMKRLGFQPQYEKIKHTSFKVLEIPTKKVGKTFIQRRLI
jgi:hypothetical protein